MRTIIVDDEPQIREGLSILLKQAPVDIVAEVGNPIEAKQQIEVLKPELLLLDVQLGSKTGFDLLESLEYTDFKLVFITAYNHYAIKAFKYNAFDYILKPVDPEELYDTMARVSKKEFQNSDLNLLKSNADGNRVVIKTTQQIYTIVLKEIMRCEADQGYTHFYLINNKHVLSSKPLKEYDGIFSEAGFVRVHQSHLVNWQHVASYDKSGFVFLTNGEKVPVSVRKRSVVSARFKY